jgi:hypothetical protein
MACKEVICRTVEIKTDKTQKSLADVDQATKKVQKSTGDLDAQLSAMPGPLSKVKQGLGGVSKAFKALLANPIVALIAAIVLALTALFKAFTKTQEGADKMKDAMAAISAVIDVVVERAAKLFKALVQIFKGNFKEGFQEMGDAVKGVGDEIREATAAAIEFEKAQRRLFEAETDVITANAERRQQIAELVFLTRDLTKSVDERREAVIKADAIEKEILADNIALSEQRLALAQAEIDNTPEQLRTREQLRAVAEAEAALINLQTESLGKQRELKNRLNTLDMEVAAGRKAIHDAELKMIQEETEARQKMADLLAQSEKTQRELDAEIDEQLREEELKDAATQAKELEQIKKEESENLAKATAVRFEKEEALIARQIANEQLLQSVKEGIYADSLNALLGFLGEGSKIAKAIQIADATKSAIQAAIAAYSSAAAIPVVGFVLGPVAAAAALAAGMANVRKIAQTPDPLGGGAQSVPSVTLARPSTDFNADDLINAQQGIPSDVSIIQDRTTRRAQKAYVVQSDVTAAQDMERQRQADVTL